METNRQHSGSNVCAIQSLRKGEMETKTGLIDANDLEAVLVPKVLVEAPGCALHDRFEFHISVQSISLAV